MGWRIEKGVPVRTNTTHRMSPPEIVKADEFVEAADLSILVCGDCGREYKSEVGLTNHIESKH